MKGGGEMKAVCLLVAAILLGDIAAASIEMGVDTPDAKPGDRPVFHINVTNTGETILSPVTVVDKLPGCLGYVSDDRNGRLSGDQVIWDDVGPLDLGEAIEINLTTEVEECASGVLTNTVNATGYPPTGYPVTDEDSQDVNVIKPRCGQTTGMNKDRLDLGTQMSWSFGDGYAANNIDMLQSEGNGSTICCDRSGQENIFARGQRAYAGASGQATNNIKIVSNGQ
jgi:uncharacterized repeat protein (TIGR01451 family)